MGDLVLYAELTPEQFRRRIAEAPIAYLPLGTLEWHGEHLPLGTDGLIAKGFFVELAQKVGGIVLPILFLGPDEQHEVCRGKDFYGMDIKGFPEGQPHQLDGSAYWVDSEQFGQMLEALLEQLARAGFKIVVGHGHGPSTRFLWDHSAEWSEEFGLKLFICWRESEGKDDEVDIITDHGASNETSLLMALYPDLVRMKNLPSDLDELPMGVCGRDPRTHASAKKGRQVIRLQKERMATLLRKAMARV
jgi:creatinine amidohydrolase